MNVFILSTGRSGSQTFARACAHRSNYTGGHESRSGLLERVGDKIYRVVRKLPVFLRNA